MTTSKLAELKEVVTIRKQHGFYVAVGCDEMTELLNCLELSLAYAQDNSNDPAG